ncbi:hypothetical protein TNCV_4038801 [Trichonephila clavipes]|nr:hypothetical protein TNCV_4038801 [Trichonephila clavipes]
MHIKLIEALSPPVKWGTKVRREECQRMCSTRHLTVIQNHEIPFWNPTQASFLDSSPLLRSSVLVQTIECMLSETSQPMAITTLSHLQVDFPPSSDASETAPVTTPPSHIPSTNQETLSLRPINIRPQSTT